MGDNETGAERPEPRGVGPKTGENADAILNAAPTIPIPNEVWSVLNWQRLWNLQDTAAGICWVASVRAKEELGVIWK